MAKILFVKNSGNEIRTILLESKELCPVDDCGHDKDCAGKSSKRNNKFICDLRKLIALYKKVKQKNKSP